MCRRALESKGEMRTRRCTPGLGLEPAVGVVALDEEGRALDAGLLAVGDVDELDLEAVLLRPARVHAQEHCRPVLALGAAGAGMDLDVGVVRIGLAGEQGLDLPPLGLGLHLADRRLALGDGGFVVLGLAELDQGRAASSRSCFQSPDGRDPLVERGALAHDGLRRLGIVPEVGVLGAGVQLGEAFLGGIPVKDASSAARWTAWLPRRAIRSRRAWCR